jgi:hypothetical protein
MLTLLQAKVESSSSGTSHSLKAVAHPVKHTLTLVLSPQICHTKKDHEYIQEVLSL